MYRHRNRQELFRDSKKENRKYTGDDVMTLAKKKRKYKISKEGYILEGAVMWDTAIIKLEPLPTEKYLYKKIISRH